MISLVVYTTALYLFSSGCIRKQFDEPPSFEDPEITPNYSIKELKALHKTGSVEKITEDKIIAAVVVADDKSGNFYKSIVVQDESGGIIVRLDGYSLFTSYPVGRKIYIKLQGLYLGDYKKWIQLGGGVDNSDPTQQTLAPIPQGLFDQCILKGKLGNIIEPRLLKTTQLKDSFQSMLIRLENFQFSEPDTGKTFADAVNKQPVNFTIKNCSNQRIILRNSGYVNYAWMQVPSGNGSISGIFSVYNSTKQILMRDTGDISFTGVRCPVATILLSQDFEKLLPDVPVASPGWRNIAQAGNSLFSVARLSGNSFAKISGFNSGTEKIKTWLVLPVINLDSTDNEVLNFITKDGYDNGATLQVLISADYNGNNSPWTATWEQLDAKISAGHATGYNPRWQNSGMIKLNKYSGNIYIAFVYEGADVTGTSEDKTTTFEIDGIKITGD